MRIAGGMVVDPDVVQAYLVLGLTLAGILTSAYTALRRLIKREISAIRDDTKQLRPNHGSHVADKVNNLDRRIDDVAELVDGYGAETRKLAAQLDSLDKHLRSTHRRRRLGVF